MAMTVTDIQNIQDKCYGCEACVAVCPAKAVVMQQNEEGFWYPTITQDCIHCRKCAKQCPAAQEWKPINTGEMHWCYDKDDTVLKKSSSGGVFYELAQLILASDGTVYAVALDEQLQAHHIAVSDKRKLTDILRSKYVQSRLDGIYPQIKHNLEEGKPVLFAGTPCQVAALHMYLPHSYETLLTVDFVCHGVPSPGFYTQMIEEVGRHYRSPLSNITFREKDNGWRKQTTKYYFENNRVVKRHSLQTFYYHAFLDNLSLRKSCFTCPFVQHHVADITMADYWGTSEAGDKGVSFVVLNTAKGQTYFQQIEDRMVTGDLQESSVKVCFQSREIIAAYDRKKRDDFFSFLKENGYIAAKKKYMRGVVANQRIQNLSRKVYAVRHCISRMIKRG